MNPTSPDLRSEGHSGYTSDTRCSGFNFSHLVLISVILPFEVVSKKRPRTLDCKLSDDSAGQSKEGPR